MLRIKQIYRQDETIVGNLIRVN